MFLKTKFKTIYFFTKNEIAKHTLNLKIRNLNLFLSQGKTQNFWNNLPKTNKVIHPKDLLLYSKLPD